MGCTTTVQDDGDSFKVAVTMIKVMMPQVTVLLSRMLLISVHTASKPTCPQLKGREQQQLR